MGWRVAESTGWTTLDSLSPGSLFETELGEYGIKTEYSTEWLKGTTKAYLHPDCYRVGTGEAVHFANQHPSEVMVRPLSLEELFHQRDELLEVLRKVAASVMHGLVTADMTEARGHYGKARAICRDTLWRLIYRRKLGEGLVGSVKSGG